jgi:prophage antirepressor-like protein
MELQTFQHEQFGNLRIMDEDGVVWFIGKDVAQALGYNNQSKAIQQHVDEEDKKKIDIRASQNGRVENNLVSRTWLINESGLYSLILSSKLPKAKAFKRWVTSEVLPSIRRTGKYEAMAQAVPINDEPATDFTQLEFDQRIRIAAIIASCRRERLPMVAKILSLDFDEFTQLLPQNASDAEQLAYQYITSVYDSMQRDTPIQYFYNGYAKWCMEQGITALNKTALGKVVKKYFPVQAVATSYYEGGQRIFGCVRCYRKMGGAAK